MIDTASHRTRALEYAAGRVSPDEWGESISGWDASVRHEAVRACYWRSAFGVYGAPAHIDVGQPIRDEVAAFDASQRIVWRGVFLERDYQGTHCLPYIAEGGVDVEEIRRPDGLVEVVIRRKDGP